MRLPTVSSSILSDNALRIGLSFVRLGAHGINIACLSFSFTFTWLYIFEQSFPYIAVSSLGSYFRESTHLSELQKCEEMFMLQLKMDVKLWSESTVALLYICKFAQKFLWFKFKDSLSNLVLCGGTFIGTD